MECVGSIYTLISTFPEKTELGLKLNFCIKRIYMKFINFVIKLESSF